jgi:hypothetical protein
MPTESNLPLKKLGPNRSAFFKDGHQLLQIFAGNLKIAATLEELEIGTRNWLEVLQRI